LPQYSCFLELRKTGLLSQSKDCVKFLSTKKTNFYGFVVNATVNTI